MVHPPRARYGRGVDAPQTSMNSPENMADSTGMGLAIVVADTAQPPSRRQGEAS
jgi:hypothetical protein